MSEDTQFLKELDKKLWTAADKLRANLDAAVYKHAVLGLVSAIKDYLITAADGKSYKTKHYNLDMILAIGYRVRSTRGVQFRRWATQTLREYLVKGFVLNDDRLKAAETTFGKDYFDELLERIRDIRASERRFYQKITDIYMTMVEAVQCRNAEALRTQSFRPSTSSASPRFNILAAGGVE